MKKVILAMALIPLIISAFSQPCLPDGIEFTTQAQIDSFQFNYPGCTEIEGDMKVAGGNISNLDGLSSVSSVIGDLRITFNQDLISISGLAGLETVGGVFLLQGADELTNISGLEGLMSIGGHLAITANNNLLSITELSNLTSIGGNLNISGNSKLTSLSGIENIDPTTIGILSFQYNSSLSTCEVLSVCEYLNNPNDTVLIQFNASGCNSIDEVVHACETISVEEPKSDSKLIIYPNPAKQELNISAEGLTKDKVVIYSITGQQIYFVSPENNTTDISHIQPGMYIVEITADGSKLRRKLLVE